MTKGLRSLALGLLLTTLATTPGAIYAQDDSTTTLSTPVSDDSATPIPLLTPKATPKIHHHILPLSATPIATDEAVPATAYPDHSPTTESKSQTGDSGTHKIKAADTTSTDDSSAAGDATTSSSDELNEFTAPPIKATHRPLPHAPVSVLVLGDSIAFGQGASDPRLGFAFDAYTHLLIKHPDSTITNHAIPGARIADVTRLELQNIKGPIDLVIIEAGANDVVHASSHDSVAAAMRILIASIKIKFPYASIIVCGIPDLSISPYFVGKAHHEVAVDSALDNAAVKAVALDMQAQFADVYLLTERIRRHATQFLGNDEFHPSDAGHLAIANLLDPLIKKAL